MVSLSLAADLKQVIGYDIDIVFGPNRSICVYLLLKPRSNVLQFGLDCA